MEDIINGAFGRHKCTVSYIPDDLPMFKKSKNVFTRMHRFLTRITMASTLHPRGHSLLDSFYCYVLEHRKQMVHTFVIHPFSDFYLIWEGLMAVVFYAQFVTIPLDVSIFQYHDQTKPSMWNVGMKFGLDVACLVDVLLRFFVGYVDSNKQEVILVPERIVMKYIFTFFIFDFISSFTAFAFFIGEEGTWVGIIKCCGLFKLVRIFTFTTYCKYIGQYFQVPFMAHGIVLLISIYLLFVHAVTCLNIFLISFQDTIDNQMYYWRLEERYDSYFWNYCGSLYKTLKMLNYLDTGFRNLNRFNMTYTIIVWVLCKLVYIWLIAYIMKFVITRKASSVKYMQLLRELKEYMRHKQLPERLQKRLLGYYEFRYQKCYFREKEILNTMTRFLRQEINTHNCMKLVENLTFFEGMPYGLLIKIVSCLHYQVFLINDVIFKYGSVGDCMYIIATGSVAVYGQRGQEVCHLKDGQYFGEVGLMGKGTRYASIVAVEICELYELFHVDFKRALRPYPQIYNKLLNIADQRVEAMRVIQLKNLTDRHAELKI